MGGQYYPGKDKSRVHLRRKTLWYRIFWSSPFRRGLSALFILYLSIAYIFNPGFNLLLHYGKLLSHHRKDGIGPDADASSITDVDVIHDIGEKGRLGHLKPLKVAREDAQKILKRLKEIKNEKMSVGKRKELMRKVIPDWFRHDMDTDTDTHMDATEGSASGAEPGMDGAKKKQNVNNGKEEAKINNNAEKEIVPDTDIDTDTDFDAVQPEEPLGKDPTLSDVNRANDTSDIIRTLRNKGQHHKESLCPRDINDISTTLVVQSTFDRLPLMKQTCERWNDPINLVVYLTVEESSVVWQQTIEDYTKSCPHLKLIPYIAKSDEERKIKYPINTMRNIGLDHVMTSHVLVVDIDLIPSQGLDQAVHSAIDLTIQARVDDDGNSGLDPKDAITIPAFERKVDSDIPCETLHDCHKLSAEDDTFIPKSMEALRECLKEKECIVFQSDVNWEGHFDTKSTQWLESNHTNSLSTIECFHSQRYEPYVVIPWCPLEENARQMLAIRSPRSPYYDERFHGYGKNKIQQIAHLRERGYNFVIMPTTGFFMHHPHPESETKGIWNDRANHDLHETMDNLYPKYLLELHHEYEGDYQITPICQRNRLHEHDHSR